MPPACGVAVEDDDLVAERRQVARDGQRGRARRRPGRSRLPFVAAAARGRQRGDVVLVVGGDALQPADRDRLLLDPAAAAGRLAGPVAGAPEDPREDVGLPVDHIGVGVAARRRSAGCIPARACGPDRPTGNRRPCGSSSGRGVGRLHAGTLGVRPRPPLLERGFPHDPISVGRLRVLFPPHAAKGACIARRARPYSRVLTNSLRCENAPVGGGLACRAGSATCTSTAIAGGLWPGGHRRAPGGNEQGEVTLAIELFYDRGRLAVTPPAGCVPDHHRQAAMPLLPDPVAAIEAALAGPGRRAAARPRWRAASARACILICDITRPVPNGLFLAPADPHAARRRRAARGHHGPGRDRAAPAERGRGAGRAGRRPLGDEHVRSSTTSPRDDADHVHLGRTPRGTVVRLDRRLVEAELKIATGLVEPHFMAGWSGGRKVIAPGVAHAETITTFHNSELHGPSARRQLHAGRQPAARGAARDRRCWAGRWRSTR